MMKRLWKRLSTLALGMALLVTTLTVSAGAVEAASVSVEMRPDVEIVVDGTAHSITSRDRRFIPCTTTAPTICPSGPLES